MAPINHVSKSAFWVRSEREQWNIPNSFLGITGVVPCPTFAFPPPIHDIIAVPTELDFHWSWCSSPSSRLALASRSWLITITQRPSRIAVEQWLASALSPLCSKCRSRKVLFAAFSDAIVAQLRHHATYVPRVTEPILLTLLGDRVTSCVTCDRRRYLQTQHLRAR